jgi:hypothetical protein
MIKYGGTQMKKKILAGLLAGRNDILYASGGAGGGFFPGKRRYKLSARWAL